MTTEEDIKIVREKIEPQIKIINNEMANIINAKVRKDGEKLHRQLSFVSVEDLLRPFTI